MTQEIKKCECCGRGFEKIPETAKLNEMGTWWNCQCGSTLFVPAQTARPSVAEAKDGANPQADAERALGANTDPDRRIVAIYTSTGRYYESHEEWDWDEREWVGLDLFDVTEDEAANRADGYVRRHVMQVDVYDYGGLDGSPVASWILAGEGA